MSTSECMVSLAKTCAFFEKPYSPRPRFFFLLTKTSFDNTILLNKYEPQGYLERGEVILSQENNGHSSEVTTWLQDFKTCIELNLQFIPEVINQLYSFKKIEGLKLLPQILPSESKAWILAGQNLLDQGLPETATFICLKGEEFRKKEINKKEDKIKKLIVSGKGQEANKILEELKTLDIDNPFVFYYRGDLLNALQQAWRRGLPLGQLDDLNKIREILGRLQIQEQNNLPNIYFFLGLIELEQKNLASAKNKFQQALDLNSNLFPALLGMEQVLERMDQGEETQKRLNQVKEKIRFYNMKEIPSGAWILKKTNENGQKIFQAIFRTSRAVKEIPIVLPEAGKWWAAFIGNRFITTEYAGKNTMCIAVALVAGEHQVKLIQILKKN